MWIAHHKLGWSFAKIGGVFNRNPRIVNKAVQGFEQYEQLPEVVEGTGLEELTS